MIKSLTTHKLDKAWKKFHVLCRTPLSAEDTSSLNKDFTGRLQKKKNMNCTLRNPQDQPEIPSHGTKTPAHINKGSASLVYPNESQWWWTRLLRSFEELLSESPRTRTWVIAEVDNERKTLFKPLRDSSSKNQNGCFKPSWLPLFFETQYIL